jgi:ABC-2 type transport system ATP-binding protein
VSIVLDSVSKRFGATLAVDRLSLEVRPGELFAFLGPNGAGKTTTIKLIAGLLKADRGEVSVCGYRIGCDSAGRSDGLAAKARMAYVPDQPFVYDKLTGREFLEFVARMYRLTPAETEQRIGQLADRLGIVGFLDQYTESYSHGMKQRVVLASAFLHGPKVLVIDEPMVGLDPRTVRTVKDLFIELVRDGGTVFMSTHTLEVADAVADRIGIIHRGRLVALGTLDGLRAERSRDASLESIFLELTADRDDPQAETVPS